MLDLDHLADRLAGLHPGLDARRSHIGRETLGQGKGRASGQGHRQPQATSVGEADEGHGSVGLEFEVEVQAAALAEPVRAGAQAHTEQILQGFGRHHPREHETA
ncbi:hypothetical protein RZS08_18245, partial [Arthrospira platensis SPKY1]|nr:hypothetical protein [Arthrospira platensis SPKY1]